MGKTFLEYQLSIDSLTVFSALKQDPVISALRRLLAVLADDAKAGLPFPGINAKEKSCCLTQQLFFLVFHDGLEPPTYWL